MITLQIEELTNEELTNEELTNEELIIHYRSENDIDKKEQIKEYFFYKNQKFPLWVACKFNSDIPHEDLASIATFGMLRAFDRFDPELGIKFNTYAVRAMQNEINMSLRKKDPMRLASSLDAAPKNNPFDDGEIAIIDILEDSSELIETQVEVSFLVSFISEQGKEILTKKEYYIIERLLSDVDLSQRDLANELNYSQSYVSRLYRSACSKLREVLEDEKKEEEPPPTISPDTVVPAGTTYNKIKFLVGLYPEVTSREVSEFLGINLSTTRSYFSTIKKESAQ